MTENTQPQIAKFISSRQTVSSEIQTRAISLGKALVQELGLEPGVDTLSRWMAHYITEQIAIAETATGRDKVEAEQQCFETILKLWKHRSSLPNSRYPFRNFKPIFQTLDSLDPDNPRSHYFNDLYSHKADDNDASNKQADEIKLWINLAHSIDLSARVLIDFALRQAAYYAKDEDTTDWLKKSTGISDDEHEDVSIIFHLTEESQEDNAEKRIHEKKRRELNSRLEKLDSFIEFSELLRDELIKHLENISDRDFNADT